MPDKVRRTIRKVEAFKVADFDDQLWPINVALLILSGFVAGIVIATTERFNDPRILSNGWFRLGVVALLMGIAFWAVTWLQGRVRRRVLFCVFVSLLVHLWMGMAMRQQYLALAAQQEKDRAQQLARQIEQITVPNYNWEQLEKPDQQQVFEKPVQTEAPQERELDDLQQAKVDQETAVDIPDPVEPQETRREQPDPAELRRAELSAPRRAEMAAGAQISRQQWKHRMEPDEPIPQPEVRPEGRETPSTLRPQIAALQRRQSRTPALQRQTFAEEASSSRPHEAVELARRQTENQPVPDRPTTPKPSRQLARAADIPRTEAQAPEPTPSAEQPQRAELEAATAAAQRQTSTPRATPRPTEVAVQTPRTVARTQTQRRQAEQTPELTQAPRSAPSRQSRQVAMLPSTAAEAQPQAAPAPAARPTELAAAPSAVSRQEAAAAPARAPSEAAEPAAMAASAPAATAVAASPRRAAESPGPTVQAQPRTLGRMARRSTPAPITPSPIAAPAAAESASSAQAAGIEAQSTEVARAAAQPGRVAPGGAATGAALPAMTSTPQLASTPARRATASAEAPSLAGSGPTRPSTLARRPSGADLPSTAVLSQDVATPAAAGGTPASNLDASAATAAVQRSTGRAPQAGTTAAAGQAQFAIGSAQVAARTGQPRAVGSDQPSVASNASAERLARASRGSPLPLSPRPEISEAPSVAAAAGGGGPATPSPTARATAIGRAGSVGIPTVAAEAAAGVGAADSPGTPGTPGTVQLARAGGAEMLPPGAVGGGTPRPARQFGRAFAGDASAETPQVAASVSPGGDAAGPQLQARVSGQERQVAGLPGSIQAEPSRGAAESLTESGAALPEAAAHRAAASQQEAGGTDLSPSQASSLARARTGVNLPAAAQPVEDAATPGAGGLAVAQGAQPSGLEVGSNATVQRASGGGPAGRITAAAGAAEFGFGAGTQVAMAGRAENPGEGLPTLAVGGSGSAIGRASTSAPDMSGAAEAAAAAVEAVAGGPFGASGGPAGSLEPTVGELAYAGRAVDGLPTAASLGEGETEAATGSPGGPSGPAGPSRAARAESGPALDLAEGPTGPSRSSGPTPAASLVATAAAPADMPEVPGGSAEGEATTPTSLDVGELGGDGPQMAGLPGELVSRIPVEGAEAAGPAAATPGTTAGPRRLPAGQDAGPTLAADVGGGPLRRADTPGLPRGVVEQAEPVEMAGTETAQPGDIDVPAGSEIGGPSRREGGLPVQIAALPGPGGLSNQASPVVGIPNRRARPESEVIHPVSRRFVVERSGGELALDGRVNDATDAYQQRLEPGERSRMARIYGVAEGTEEAVEMGLDFLARHQFPDGRWALDRLPGDGPEYKDPGVGTMNADTAGTGLALLAFYGAGYTHQADKHREVVRRGLDWLLANQREDGALFSDDSDQNRFSRSYGHGIATIALCEAYGMTRDPELREPARKAIEFIIQLQHPDRGGWRYTPNPNDPTWQKESDTSVSGWQLMALKSAQMAGLDVPQETLERVNHWLDLAEDKDGGKFRYNPYAGNSPEQRAGREPNLAMTAEGLLMRMYLGAERDEPDVVKGADYLKANLPAVGTPRRSLRDGYYWYYATQVMFQMQDDYWNAWKDRLFPLLRAAQVQKGPLAGSWDPNRPTPDRWSHAAGRHYITTLNLLMLEVHYRHLPLFQTLGK